jgi:hypothetical protein
MKMKSRTPLRLTALELGTLWTAYLNDSTASDLSFHVFRKDALKWKKTRWG